MTVFLCGFMGCGKTTVGKILAKKLGCSFCDSDDIIVEKVGMTIPKIFSQKGEPYFRKVEAETIKELCGREVVVACGGGAMLDPETAEYALKAGKVAFIDVDFETCYNRICNDSNRPIAASSTKESLYKRFCDRREIYIKHSSFTIAGNDTPLNTADKIINWLHI